MVGPSWPGMNNWTSCPGKWFKLLVQVGLVLIIGLYVLVKGKYMQKIERYRMF